MKGVAGVGEGAGKLAAGGIAQVADWLGNDEYANKIRTKLVKNPAPVTSTLENKIEKPLDKYSVSGGKADNLTENIGQMAGYWAGGEVTGALAGASGLSVETAAKVGKAVSDASMFTSAAGNSLSESYSKDNVKDWQAWTKAVGSGGLEVLTERLFGLFGTSGLDTGLANKVSGQISSGIGKVLARNGIQASGEAVEEMLSYIGNQGLDKMIDSIDNVTGGKGAKFHQNWNWEDVGEQMGMAFLSASLIGGGTNISSTINNKTNSNTWIDAINENAKQQDIAGQVTDLNNEIEKIENKKLKETDVSKINELNNELYWKQKQLDTLATKNINNVQQTNPIASLNTQQESNVVAPINTLENNQQSLYNNSNESESGINGQTIKQNEQRGIARLSEYTRGENNNGGHQENNEKQKFRTKQEDIEYAINPNNYLKKLNEGQQKIKQAFEKKGVKLNYYDTESRHGGFYKDNNLLVNTNNTTLQEQKDEAIHEYAHHLIRDNIEFNNKVIPIADRIIKDESNETTESIRNYIMQKGENITVDEVEDIYKTVVEEILADYAIDISNKVDFNNENKYGIDRNILNDYKSLIEKYLPEIDIENSNQSSFSIQENKPIPPIANNKEVVSNTVPKVTSDSTFLNETTSFIDNSIPPTNQNVNSDTITNNYTQNYENNAPFANNIQEEQNRGKQSSFYKNALTSQALNQEAKKQIRGNSNIKYYEDISNAETFSNAMERLNDLGDKAVLEFNNIDINNATAEDITLGFQLMQKYQNKGDYHTEALIAERLRQMGTKKGQAVQAFSILQRMSPEGMLIYTQRQINNAKENILQNKSQSWIDKNQDIINNMELTEEETQKIVENMQAINEGAEGREKEILLGEIQKIFTDKIPPTLGDSFKAYRRIAMLFNPKTQVRNVFGNLGVAPINMIGDSTIGALTDKLISKKTGIRTTGATDLKTYGKSFIKGGVEAFDDFRRGINTRDINGDKFEIGNQGKAFKDKRLGKALNKIDALTNFALDVGDRPFFKAEFMNALNNQMKLNNVDTPTVEMIETATRVAEQRTWQDNNKYSDTVVNIRKSLNSINIGGVGFGDIVIPFAKTPANLTKAIVDYSPLGVVNAIVDANNLRKSVSKGTMSAIQQRKLVDDVSKAFMGSILYIIGYGLAKSKISSGESDKDKDVANFEKNILGIQPYSIKIGNRSFTYDWAQPLGAPLGIMANAVNKDKNESMAQSIFNAVSQGGNMVYEQSFLQNIKKLLSGDDLVKSTIESIADIPASLVPTFLKQIAEVADPTARTSYEYNNIAKTGLNKAIARIPFASKTLSPSVDTMGKEIQKYGGEANLFNIFLNPATTSKRKENASAEEIYRLYKETGDKSVFPRVANYYETLNKEKKILTSEEKSEVQKISGTEANKLIESTIKNNAYKKLSNDQKVDIINDLVNYTFNKATNKVIKKELSPENKSIQKYIDAGLSAGNAVIFKNTVNNIEGEKDKSGNSIKGSSSGKKALEIMNMNVNNDQKNIMLKLMTESKNPETVDTLSRLAKTKDAYTEYFALNKSDTFFQSKISRDDMQDIQDLGINQDEFIKYAENVESIKSDKDSKGRTISGSKKKKVANYINSLNLNSVEKAILFAKAGYADNNYKQSVYQYINKKNLSASRKKEIWDSLGYK